MVGMDTFVCNIRIENIKGWRAYAGAKESILIWIRMEICVLVRGASMV